MLRGKLRGLLHWSSAGTNASVSQIGHGSQRARRCRSISRPAVDLEVEVLAAIGSHVVDEEKLEKEQQEEMYGICEDIGTSDDEDFEITVNSYPPRSLIADPLGGSAKPVRL